MTAKKKSNLKQVIALILAVGGGLGSLVTIYQMMFPKQIAEVASKPIEDFRIYRSLPDTQKKIVQQVHVINFWVDEFAPLIEKLASAVSLVVGVFLLLFKVRQEKTELEVEKLREEALIKEQRRWRPTHVPPRK